MKASDLMDAIERFFLDLIGTVIPGLLLVVGWVILFGRPRLLESEPILATLFSKEWVAWTTLLLGFVLGHLVTGAGGMLVSVSLPTFLRKSRWTKWAAEAFKSSGEIAVAVGGSEVYRLFVARSRQTMPWLADMSSERVHDWRSIAMSLISPQENHTVYRFMFISLLNLGAGTVCVLLGSAWMLSTLATHLPYFHPWRTFLFPDRRPLDISVVIVGIIVAYIFFERRSTFYSRALRVPFSMAIVKLEMPTKLLENNVRDAVQTEEQPTVYLAGGMRSNWQDLVIRQLPGWRFIDPRAHHLSDEQQYTLWDLEGIRKSDWVLANFEVSNPAGYNLAVEIGYAAALGKHVLLVDEKSAADETVKRYTGMLRGCARATTSTLDEAIFFLRQLPVRRGSQ